MNLATIRKTVPVDGGSASEDDDFVALRVRRKRHESEDQEEEESFNDLATRALSDTIIIKFFEDAVTASRNDFENLLNQVQRLDLVHPETNRNLLLHLLHVGRIDLAKLVVSRSDDSLLMQDCDVAVASLKGKKNALHYVTELRDVDLAREILSRITDQNKKMTLLQQETPVKIEGQRPRTLPCTHLAAFLGSLDLVVLYLTHGVMVDALSSKKDTALLWAVRLNHLNIIQELLLRRADPNKENDRGSTALYWAVRYGHAESVRLLIAAGADVNKTRKMGLVSPLTLACALGYLPIVRLLLRGGADPNICLRGQERPIHLAAREGYADIVECLLQQGARIDEQDEGGDTALLYAARYGHARCLQLLLARGANHAVRNQMGEDLMSLAVKSNNSQILKIMLHSVKDRKEGRGPRSPLLLAAAAGQVEKIDTLISMGHDPTITDNRGNTMMHHAAMKNQHHVIQKYHGKVNIDAQNNKGNTPLHEACARGHATSIDELIKARAATGIRNENGRTPLHLLAQCRATPVNTVKKLMDYIIKTHAWESLNVKDKEGNNALHIAAKFARPEVMWEFRHVPFNVKNAKGNIALHEAVRTNEPDALMTMLDIYEASRSDADINEQNTENQTLLHLVANEGFDQHIARLVLLGADLSMKDAEGNTVLHTLAKLSAMYPEKAKTYLSVFQSVLEQAPMWWCMKYQRRYPQGDSSALEAYTQRASLQLLTEIYNDDNTNVMGMACQGATSYIMQLILAKKGVMCYEYDDCVLYNVTNMTPITNNSTTGWFCLSRAKPRPSYIESLLSMDEPEMACKVLDVQPFREIERAYSSVTAWVYLIIIAVHIIYMSLFSYSGIALLARRQSNPKDRTVDGATVLLYVIVPIEPAVILLLDLYRLVKIVYSSEMPSWMTLKRRLRVGVVLQTLYLAIPDMTGSIYSVLVFAWLVVFKCDFWRMDFIFALAVCFGWLYTLAFSRGLRVLHYIWRRIQNIVVRFLLTYILIYTLMVLAFAFAFLAMFQFNKDMAVFYPDVLDTSFMVFNMMFGFGDLYANNFINFMKTERRSSDYLRVLYIFYIILSYLLIWNLLNAVAGDVSSALLKQHRMAWRVESVQLGVDIEKTFPTITRLFSFIKLRKNAPEFTRRHDKRPSLHQILFSNTSSDESPLGKRSQDIWSISVPIGRVRAENILYAKTVRESLQEMKSKMSSIEQRMISDLQQVKHDVDDIRASLKDLDGLRPK